MIIYNGFKPGERRSTVLRPRKKDGGHSIVKTTTVRLGSRFQFKWSQTCECGKTYSSERSPARVWQSMEAHRKKETAS